jgi:hypothetical protein
MWMPLPSPRIWGRRSHGGLSNEPMGRLEARLDRQQFPPAAIIPGREVQLLEDPAYGGTVPARVSLLPATRQQAWTTYVFDANPGDSVAFVVKSYGSSSVLVKRVDAEVQPE